MTDEIQRIMEGHYRLTEHRFWNFLTASFRLNAFDPKDIERIVEFLATIPSVQVTGLSITTTNRTWYNNKKE